MSKIDLVAAASRPFSSRIFVRTTMTYAQWYKSIGVLPKFSVPAVAALAERRGSECTMQLDASLDIVFDCEKTESHPKVDQVLIRVERLVVSAGGSETEPLVLSDLDRDQTEETRDILLWVKRLLADDIAEDPQNQTVFKNQALVLGYDPDVRRRAHETLASSTSSSFARMMAERERNLEGKILFFL
jgi:hypothetical protein